MGVFKPQRSDYHLSTSFTLVAMHRCPTRKRVRLPWASSLELKYLVIARDSLFISSPTSHFFPVSCPNLLPDLPIAQLDCALLSALQLFTLLRIAAIEQSWQTSSRWLPAAII